LVVEKNICGTVIKLRAVAKKKERERETDVHIYE
jgi:hypothetical protein